MTGMRTWSLRAEGVTMIYGTTFPGRCEQAERGAGNVHGLPRPDRNPPPQLTFTALEHAGMLMYGTVLAVSRSPTSSNGRPGHAQIV